MVEQDHFSALNSDKNQFFGKMYLAIHEHSLEAFQGVKVKNNMPLKTSNTEITKQGQTNQMRH